MVAWMLAKLGKVPAVVFLILPILMPIGRCYSLPSTPSVDRTVVTSRSQPACTASPVPFLLSTWLSARRCCVGDLPVLSLTPPVVVTVARTPARFHSLSLSIVELGLGFLGSWWAREIRGDEEKRDGENEGVGWGRWNRVKRAPLISFSLFYFFYFVK